MTLRSQARDFLINSATLLRADRLALRLQQRRGRALIVAMHETPASHAPQFRSQLDWAAQHFTITGLEGFTQLWAGRKKAGSKPPVLFTFDDGRESNYTVAAPLLESFGARGVFFVVPDFADCPSDRALAFYRSRINPNSKPGDEAWEDWKPMNPAQIADLAARGHTIGNHTLTHQRLVNLDSDQLEKEIGESARKLESWTKKPVDAFAWTFGWNAIDSSAWQTACRYHRYCFAACPGAIDPERDSQRLLWRREIEVKYSPAEYRFLYSGLGDFWWRTRRDKLRHMTTAGQSGTNNR
ncbi:MAG TPA: polysaccharide deacetylase family protein [Candidatus Binatia bacterium]|nr:polysaccharide deacetylase family protein [Candidatus Binatia bacterium]